MTKLISQRKMGTLFRSTAVLRDRLQEAMSKAVTPDDSEGKRGAASLHQRRIHTGIMADSVLLD